MSLKQQAAGGVKWTSVSAMYSAIIQIVQISVLARFLDKKDFGLMAIALFVIGITQIFIDMGISNSIIHKQRVNKFQLSTLYWLNILVGVTLFLLIFLFAPLIAIFYKAADLTNIIRTVAIVFLIAPWGQQFESLLMKDLNFKAIAIRDISGRTVGLFVAVTLALYNFGVYSLVYANISASCISACLLIIFGLKNHQPKLLFSYRSIKGKGFFSFGLFQMGEKLLNYFNSQFDTLIIGRLLGMEALGIYNIAKTLTLKPYQIINPVVTKIAFPVLAKIQNEIEKLKNAYLVIVSTLSFINAIIYGLMILLAPSLILIVFGSEWLVAVPYLQILSISAFCSSIGNPMGALQLARGRADWGFYWNLTKIFIMPFALYLGAVHGLMGVSWALAIMKIALLLPTWYFFIRPLCKATFREYFSGILTPPVTAILAGLLSCLLFFINNWILFSIATIVLFSSVYVILTYFFNRQLLVNIGTFIPERLKKGMLKIKNRYY